MIYILLFILCIPCLLAAQPSELRDEALYHVRRKEIESEAKIERLSIDAAIVENQWKKARQAYMQKGPDSNTDKLLPLIAAAHWEQLKSIRYELKNTQFSLSYLQQYRKLRLSFFENVAIKSQSSQYWEKYLDSLEILKIKLQKELQWVREHLSEIRFELKALTSAQIIDSDTVIPEAYHWHQQKIIWVQKQLKADSILLALENETTAPLDTLTFWAQKALSRITTPQKVANLFDKLLSIWDYEWRKENGRSITTGKIIIALLLIILGLKIAHLLSHLSASIVVKRFGMHPGVADAGQKLFFYGFSVLIVIVALHSIQVPLTAFTVAGGALALGIGFGSQTILNNFISGLILLVERPIKTGDFVEVDSVMGTVEKIGLRSTRIRTPGNVHLVIPNASFIEKNVVNWTLEDRLIRLELKVGVIYGSPVREVKRLLIAATTEMVRVLNKPEPMVIFSDFGDDALVFNLLFWIKIENITERRTILSAVRFRVNDLFTQAGIVIAFPQRDIHFDAQKPIPIVINRASKMPETRKTRTEKFRKISTGLFQGEKDGTPES